MPPSSNNCAQLIKFPTPYNGPTKNPDEIRRRVLSNKMQASSDVVGYIVPPLIEALMDVGVNLDDNQLKSMLLIALIKNIVDDHLSVDNELSAFIHKYRKQIQTIVDNSIISG